LEEKMADAGELKFQIGKNGVTDGTIEFLNNALKTHKNLRISVFKSSGRERDSIKVMAEDIQKRISYPSVVKIIGLVALPCASILAPLSITIYKLEAPLAV
jgi:RNA-binding protein YhbY